MVKNGPFLVAIVFVIDSFNPCDLHHMHLNKYSPILYWLTFSSSATIPYEKSAVLHLTVTKRRKNSSILGQSYEVRWLNRLRRLKVNAAHVCLELFSLFHKLLDHRSTDSISQQGDIAHSDILCAINVTFQLECFTYFFVSRSLLPQWSAMTKLVQVLKESINKSAYWLEAKSLKLTDLLIRPCKFCPIFSFL